ncbi:MAG: hypothetical protein JXO22_11245 [Phycisphaerae bacterium]|nr:hypothetical protein [Phycisphaerae bacterium]
MDNGSGGFAVRVVCGLLLIGVLVAVIWVGRMSPLLQAACTLVTVVAMVPLMFSGGTSAQVQAETVNAKAVTTDALRITGGRHGGVELAWNADLREFKINLKDVRDEPLATFVMSLDEQRPIVLYDDSSRKMHVIKTESFEDHTRY